MSTAKPADWRTRPTLRTAEEWIARAVEVAAVLATDAAERDRGGATSYAEVRLLKDSGLVTLLGPVEHGGAGQDWPTAYRIVREVAKADGSIGQLLGYHYLWNWATRLVGTREQWEHVEAEAARNRWFFGGAVNPRDQDVTVTEDGDDLVFTGRKSFSTGSKVSDVTVLEGVFEGTDRHVFAIVPSDSGGLTFHDDWDNIGQRLTEGGSVTIDGVRTPWSSAAGYVDKEFQPRVYNTFDVPAIQLVFVNLYLGIAAGALETAAAYTRAKTQPWLHGGGGVRP
ncbi:Dibenzothiophene desulfurization enzyme C [Streptomyces sp. enrichment culture]